MISCCIASASLLRWSDQCAPECSLSGRCSGAAPCGVSIDQGAQGAALVFVTSLLREIKSCAPVT